ncbi:hypothetical protein CO180_00700 [candidate division WWE3 bacterium CG_4_9_14_3_um_filter_41_6]|uniref:UDP-N-acetylglucosamine--N-acetylmuramyl-(pentapeptide) pyrophosphoryl-undecaprenol N-acetylglucosamine transferase n=1 Tax=candidate division WWE3 bacterium CG_4_10_14_0_2_um_filter_41_14 TaxID=1975072 RepID=A0A2M7THJ2_UNCKA|nr:MAG: hypothetical protein COY32_04760 [candidate division WWE3 bacterium CG_4_10_14_0_2_um_filter_41_14]PJA39469.1 MAG: hypothetical protein CO180_00700 [candidate division WWE3 bacterium CG_4_9_14_3_um_filter_41_6]
MSEDTKIPTIVFTGGHHNSALTIARELAQTDQAKIVWYGHKFSMAGDTNETAEYREVTKSGIVFREILAGKVYKTFQPLQWIRLPIGIIQSFWFLLLDRPQLIVSFGGYLAAPVVLSGWVLRIPSITHEQTTVVGLANRFIGKFAKTICITWPQSKTYFDQSKVVITGLPLRDSLFTVNKEQLFTDDQLPIVYITGGKQGSHIINDVVAQSLDQLLQRFNVIHQTGGNTQFNDYHKHQDLKTQLPAQLASRYMVKEYIFEDEIGNVFSQADIVLTRAGAHVLYEIAALGKPAIFVPIPWVSHNEQYKNARLLVNEGSALIVPEDRFSVQSLMTSLDTILQKKEQFASCAQTAREKIIYNAKERIINEIKKILSKEE